MNHLTPSIQHSHIGPRAVASMPFSREDVESYAALGALGIGFEPGTIRQMAQAFAMDDQQGGVTTGSMATPIQFLQTWLPGFVRVITAARKIDELIGISTIGSWEDQEVVQGVMEPIGNAVPYGDYTNVPLASWNVNYERRTVVQFEKGFSVGRLEEARAARMNANTAAEKRNATSLSLEIQRNLIGFFGYNNGLNRTYGFLNDPSLPAYYNVAAGASASTTWAQKQFLEITADIRQAFSKLQTQSQDTIDANAKMTLAIATSCAAYLSVTSTFGNSVQQWIKETYPNMRVVSAPQLNSANGGANVLYLYAESVDDGATDDSRVWVQVVPAKFKTLGVQQRAKDYVEDFSNATAGVMLKRPYAVVRASGI